MSGKNAGAVSLLCACAAWCVPPALGGQAAPAAKPSPKARAEASARKAAKWLLAHANPDGTFGQSRARAMPGIVGLALYALAKSPAHPRGKKIKQAAAYLAGKQLKNGAIAIPAFGLENYNTSVAAMALKALDDPKYKELLEKAKQFILSCQLDDSKGYKKDEHNRAYGGFGYGSAKRADLSNTSFSLEALKELGVPEDSPAFKNALLFVRRCQDNPETNDVQEMKNGEGSGGFVYLPGESEFGTYKTRSGKEVPKPYGNMTYAGVKSLIYCGLKKDSPELQAAWKWIKKNYTVKYNPGGQGHQGYYYYIAAFAKAFAAAGMKELTLADGKKVHWAEDLSRQLASVQKPDGSFANDARRWMESDPVLATSYGLIALNLCVEAMK